MADWVTALPMDQVAPAVEPPTWKPDGPVSAASAGAASSSVHGWDGSQHRRPRRTELLWPGTAPGTPDEPPAPRKRRLIRPHADRRAGVNASVRPAGLIVPTRYMTLPTSTSTRTLSAIGATSVPQSFRSPITVGERGISRGRWRCRSGAAQRPKMYFSSRSPENLSRTSWSALSDASVGWRRDRTRCAWGASSGSRDRPPEMPRCFEAPAHGRSRWKRPGCPPQGSW